MESVSLSEIKKELKTIAPQQLQELCLRLAKYKKENKELLSYLLFDAIDEQAFVQNVKNEIDEQFKQLNKHSIYLAKKTIRKVLKTTDKFIKFSGSKETEIELLIHFCQKLKKSGLNIRSRGVIFNIYQRRVERVKKVLSLLHEDLQFDYEEAVEEL